MNTWKTNALELPVAQEPKLIDEYAKVAIDSVLSKYEESGIAGRPDAGPLNEWFTKRALKSQQLFKNDPNSVLEWVRPVKN